MEGNMLGETVPLVGEVNVPHKVGTAWVFLLI